MQEGPKCNKIGNILSFLHANDKKFEQNEKHYMLYYYVKFQSEKNTRHIFRVILKIKNFKRHFLGMTSLSLRPFLHIPDDIAFITTLRKFRLFFR